MKFPRGDRRQQLIAALTFGRPFSLFSPAAYFFVRVPLSLLCDLVERRDHSLLCRFFPAVNGHMRHIAATYKLTLSFICLASEDDCCVLCSQRSTVSTDRVEDGLAKSARSFDSTRSRNTVAMQHLHVRMLVPLNESLERSIDIRMLVSF
jgi:hypothetical protein